MAPESARDTVGFLESVSVIGDKLYGKLRIVEDSIKERVRKGLAKRCLSRSIQTLAVTLRD